MMSRRWTRRRRRNDLERLIKTFVFVTRIFTFANHDSRDSMSDERHLFLRCMCEGHGLLMVYLSL
jgi:hypothetical protein